MQNYYYLSFAPGVFEKIRNCESFEGKITFLQFFVDSKRSSKYRWFRLLYKLFFYTSQYRIITIRFSKFLTDVKRSNECMDKVHFIIQNQLEASRYRIITIRHSHRVPIDFFHFGKCFTHYA